MHILLIEDDAKTAVLITEGLHADGHVVHWAATGPDGLNQARRNDTQMLIVDRLLPELDGLSLLRMLRREGCTRPVLMLTSLGDIEERVDGLNSGADDYLAKPFAMAELLARVQVLGRRAGDAGPPACIVVAGLEIDVLARTVKRNGEPIELPEQEFHLLHCLARNAGRIVTRAMLLEQAWEIGFAPRSNLVDSHISRLRARLEDGTNGELIETVRGAGYVLRA